MSTFNLEYFLSVSAGLLAGYMVNSANPRANSVIKFFVVPLTVAYFVLILVNSMAPWINSTGYRVRMYAENKLYGQINNLSYIQVFPPLFAILIIFLVLLYSGNLG